MDELIQWLFPGTEIRTVLRVRPASVRAFEALGIDPFAFPAEPIGRACTEHGVSWDAFLAEMRKPADPAGPRPRTIPLPALLERLTGEHRKFIRSYLPAIGEAFAPRGGVVAERLRPLFKEWPAFMSGLKEHIATEEEFLFPKILRYDYCLRHGKADPEFSNGSVKVFVAIHLLKNEERGTGALRRILEEPLPSPSADDREGGESALIRLLAAFRKELLEHARVEREELFPMAASLENELYDRSISGRTGPRGESVTARI
jgi:iron-sulfur cluster repair protein YtfE (RIC family)